MVALMPPAFSQLPSMAAMLHGGGFSCGRCACTDSRMKPESSTKPKVSMVQKHPR
uniref:Uncharacterized protein n=1 Tax=Arundo donax TaxID=35708 RepID=A0A0A9HD24_ARUDO